MLGSLYKYFLLSLIIFVSHEAWESLRRNHDSAITDWTVLVNIEVFSDSITQLEWLTLLHFARTSLKALET